MATFKVNSCCGCITLRNGTIIVAVLGLLGTIIQLSQVIYTKINYEDIRIDDDSATAKEQLNLSAYINKMSGVILLASSLYGLILTLLLYGAITRSKHFLLPWLILDGSSLVVIVYVCVILSVISPLILLVIPCLSLGFYIWMVVFSYYQQLMTMGSNQSDLGLKLQV